MAIKLNDLKCIYFPISKVASTSIKFAIVRYITDKVDVRMRGFSFPSISNKDVWRFSHYHRFAFVRNPWDRLVSCYAEKILNDPLTNKWFNKGVSRSILSKQYLKDNLRCGMSFKEFAKFVCSVSDWRADCHFGSQYHFLVHNKDILVNKIYRFENMEEEWKSLCEMLGTELILLHKNNSNRTSYQDYYTSELVNLVARRYRLDIKFFKYEF